MNIFFAVDQLSNLSALEVHKLYKLRVDVFVYEQQCPYQEIDDIDAQDTTLHVQAWQQASLVDRELLGCARLYPDVTAAGHRHHLGRVCVDKRHRGTKLGQEVMRQTLRLAFEQNPEWDVYLEAQTDTVGFYEQFGFQVAGDAFDWEGVSHTPMVLPAATLTDYSLIDA